MSNSLIKDISIAYLLPIVILCYTFSFFWGWFPMTHTIYMLFLGLMICLFVSRGFFSSKQFLFLIWFEVILWFNMMTNDHLHPAKSGFVFEMLFILVTAMISYYYMKVSKVALFKVTVLMLMSVLIANAVGTIFVETVFPGSVRAVVRASREEGTVNIMMSFYKMGMASYEMTHAIPTMIPMLVFGVKAITNKRIRLFFIAALVACMVLCYLGGSTTALILGVFALLIALVTKTDRGKNQIIAFGLFAGVLMLILSNDAFMLSFLQWADDLMGNAGEFHGKIEDFQMAIVSGSSESVEGRGELYSKSVTTIIENPLIGTNDNTMGHHSTLLDHWACLGIVGFFPYIVFFYLQLRWTLYYVPEKSRLFYFEGAMMAVVMLATKSIDGWESWLFVFAFLPMMAKYVGMVELSSIKQLKR